MRGPTFIYIIATSTAWELVLQLEECSDLNMFSLVGSDNFFFLIIENKSSEIRIWSRERGKGLKCLHNKIIFNETSFFFFFLSSGLILDCGHKQEKEKKRKSRILPSTILW